MKLLSAKTNLRKMQLAVSKSMAFHSSHDASNSGGLSKSHSSHSFGHSTGASQESTQLFEDSYFIPKKTIVRPDGASLYDVYRYTVFAMCFCGCLLFQYFICYLDQRKKMSGVKFSTLK